MSELFRREAVEHATRRLVGDVVLASPAYIKLIGGLLVFIVVAAAVLASVATYARRETVEGWLVPESGLIRIAAKEAGIVDTVEAPEGADVAAGAPLVTLRLSSDVVSGDAGASLIRNISAEGEAESAEARAAQTKLNERQADLATRRAALTRERDEAKRRAAVLIQRQELAEEQVTRAEELSGRGFTSISRVDALRAEALSVAEDASTSRASILTLERQMSDVDAAIAGLGTDRATLDARAARNRAALTQRRVSAETRNSIVATAPIAGRVVAVPVQTGQAVPAGASLATLTPRGAGLTAELFVPSRAAGFINVGQEVRLMYEAFPFQTFGTGKGVIKSVSPTVFGPNELTASGIKVGEPVFRVRVALERKTVSAYGRAMPLQPGMLLRADVIIDRRSLLEWLLNPLYAVGRRG